MCTDLCWQIISIQCILSGIEEWECYLLALLSNEGLPQGVQIAGFSLAFPQLYQVKEKEKNLERCWPLQGKDYGI